MPKIFLFKEKAVYYQQKYRIRVPPYTIRLSANITWLYIVRGIIVDDSGNVECTVDNRMNTSNPWTRLPLSSKSCTLIATVPLKNGNPMWTPEKVEFLPQGLALDVADITEDLYMDILDICNEVIPLKRECKNRNAANAAIC